MKYLLVLAILSLAACYTPNQARETAEHPYCYQYEYHPKQLMQEMRTSCWSSLFKCTKASEHLDENHTVYTVTELCQEGLWPR